MNELWRPSSLANERLHNSLVLSAVSSCVCAESSFDVANKSDPVMKQLALFTLEEKA